MPHAWFLGLFCAVAWTFFLLLERAWPDVSSAVVLPVALAAGLSAATYDQLSSDVQRKKNWSSFALLGFVLLLTGVVMGMAVNQLPYVVDLAYVDPLDSLSAFVLQGPALFLLLNIILDTIYRRQAALLNGAYVYGVPAFALKTGLVAAAGFASAYIAFVLVQKAGETHRMALLLIPYAAGVAMTVIVGLMLAPPRRLRSHRG